MTNYVEFLYRALEAKVGIVVETPDTKFLLTKLYQVRTKSQNPEFWNLTFGPSRANPETEIWIIRKG